MNTFLQKKMKKATAGALVLMLLFSVSSPLGNLASAIAWPPDYAVIYTSIWDALTASGITNNFTGVTNGNAASFPNLEFGNTFWKITFVNNMDLTDSWTISYLQNLGSKFSAGTGNTIGLTTSWSTFQGYPAIITATFPAPILPAGTGSENMVVIRDDAGNILDWSGILSNMTCAIGIWWDETCFFNTAHFTTFDFKPTARVEYSTTGATNSPVIVTLTGASEPITITNNSGALTKTFEVNGSFTFNFVDVSGNTGSTTATVNNISTVSPVAVDLLSAGNFVILTKTAITDIPTSSITGNIGASPISGTAIGVTCAEVTGMIYSVDANGPLPCRTTNATLLTTAVGDMETAYANAAGRTNPTATELGAGDIGGLTITPGLYKWSTDVTIPTDITLSGSANDVWIFQIAGNLDIASKGSIGAGVKVLLSGGAKASNIFWQVGGVTGATLGTYSTFNGTILSAKQIILQTGAVLNGRALAQTQVTLDTNTITNTTSTDNTAPVISDKRVDSIISSAGTVKFDFTDANYTVGTGTGYITIGTGASLTNEGTWYLTVVTGATNTASSTFSSLVASTMYNYAISVIDNFGNVSSTATGSFFTASAPIDLMSSSTNTGTTTLTGATIASGSGLALSGTIVIISNPNDSNALTGSLILSGVTLITVSGSTWNGVLLPPTSVASGSTNNATLGELGILIPQDTSTTDYTNTILQTIQAGGGSGVSLTASGANFQISVLVSLGTAGDTLKLYRSSNGTSWVANSPDATCTLTASKMCAFSTDHLSYFAIVKTTSVAITQPSSSGGGGGSTPKDNCPNGDYTNSYYDGLCGTTVSLSGATIDIQKTENTVTVTMTTASGAVTTSIFNIPGQVLKTLKDIKFTDISSNWAKGYIEKLVARGIINNTEKYNPDNNLTRAEFLKIAFNAAGWNTGTGSTALFKDVATNAWYAPYVSLAVSKGIISDKFTNFRPNDTISRAEAAKIIVGIFGGNTANKKVSFADVDGSSDLAKYIEAAKDLGFFSGQLIDGKLKFRPDNSITRAEIAKVIVNAFGL